MRKKTVIQIGVVLVMSSISGGIFVVRSQAAPRDRDFSNVRADRPIPGEHSGIRSSARLQDVRSRLRRKRFNKSRRLYQKRPGTRQSITDHRHGK